MRRLALLLFSLLAVAVATTSFVRADPPKPPAPPPSAPPEGDPSDEGSDGERPSPKAPPKPSPPAPPATGFGSEDTPFKSTTVKTFPNPQFAASSITVVAPAGGTLPERLPVVLFAHGFGAQSHARYWPWLQHIAKEGCYVVFPIYPPLPRIDEPGRYEVLWAGFEAAVKEIEAGGGPKPDLTRLGFLGHSFGGGAVPAMAARAVGRGWGGAAMWIECYAPWYDLDPCAWPALPAHAFLLAVAYEDDAICDPATAAHFLKKATTLADEKKRFLLVRSDAHGSPRIAAEHLAPLAYPPDALDRLGHWRLDDALRTLAITGSKDARAAVFGEASTSLGAWSDGVAVRPLATSWPPEGGTPKRLRGWPEGTPQEQMMRTFLSKECCCRLPLPSPEHAPASRLLPAERIVRPAPSGGWPAEIAKGFAASPLLVVLHRETIPASVRTVAAIDAAARALAERDVKVTRIDVTPPLPLAERLGVLEYPSVLLFAKGGELLLWREGDEPNLVPAILDLTRKP